MVGDTGLEVGEGATERHRSFGCGAQARRGKTFSEIESPPEGRH